MAAVCVVISRQDQVRHDNTCCQYTLNCYNNQGPYNHATHLWRKILCSRLIKCWIMPIFKCNLVHKRCIISEYKETKSKKQRLKCLFLGSGQILCPPQFLLYVNSTGLSSPHDLLFANFFTCYPTVVSHWNIVYSQYLQHWYLKVPS